VLFYAAKQVDMNQTVTFYNQNAIELSKQYNSVDFEKVHGTWKPHWPLSGDMVLDVGAGNGRDALWMAEQGADVMALEPAQSMLEIGKELTGPKVTWLCDKLPELNKIEQLGVRFDLILVSAVWMHLAPTHRARAFRKLSNLLNSNGKLVITLRHGEFNDARQGYDVSAEEIEKLAKDSALLVHSHTSSEDALNRDGIQWETMVLCLPEDGSGDLTKVRHIIVNDTKTSTYKLALLRVLLRVADAHPGCVTERTGGKVYIPLGLVALYWIKAYKRLIDVGQLQQSSNANTGLSFVTNDGWNQIKHLSADDLAIGSLLIGDDATALQKTIKAAIHTMKTGPIKFTTTGAAPNAQPLFHTEAPAKRSRIESTLCIDSTFLESFGTFALNDSFWECLRIYNSWIEPLVVNQWIRQMQRFELNRANQVSLQTYNDCLIWLDKNHDTTDVRKRVVALQNENQHIRSVWSNKSLKSQFHVDHCVPFAYWPNNDKWNLLPTTAAENLNKKDRLPSKQRLNQSRQRIIEWWELAWGSDGWKNRFFVEASLSLPNVPVGCCDFEEVFEAMGLQIRGVKSRLLMNEW
jgi:SAM-dependent methyltransferase